MDSLTTTLRVSVSGRAKGITGNSNLQAPLSGFTLNADLSSAGTGATLANNGYIGTRTLAASANETLDLRAFTNMLGQTAQSLSKLKFFYVKHSTASAAAASTITVGNSGANALIIQGMFGATAAVFSPSSGAVLEILTSAGIVVDATHKDVKIVNNDGVNIATYEIGWFGE